jgi:hypothetical protein
MNDRFNEREDVSRLIDALCDKEPLVRLTIHVDHTMYRRIVSLSLGKS